MASFIVFRKAVARLALNTPRHLHSSPVLSSKYRQKIPYERAWLAEQGQALREVDVEEFRQSLTPEQKIEIATTEPRVIIKVVDRELKREKEKELKVAKQERTRKNERKEIQFSWSVAPGDIAHKMKSIKKELEKGAKVDIVFSPKKKTTPPEKAEMEKRLQEIEDELEEFGKPWRDREIIAHRGIAATFLRGVHAEGD